MRPFEPIATPLKGPSLIEAGAGTGKTYTITTLVLRLVLERGLTPEQILVVTFTTAATAELRDRLRGRFRDARRLLQAPCPADPQLERLLAACGPREITIRRLEDALANFDRMPVYTIHGFCQRVLTEMAFETGSGFDAELVADDTAIVQEIADDFWRRTWHRPPPELTAFAQGKLKTPEHMASLYRRYAVPAIDLLPDAERLPTVACEDYRTLWSLARKQWLEDRSAILDLLTSPDLKANIYGSLDRPADLAGGRHKRDEKCQAWASQIDRWTRSAVSAFPPPEILTYVTQSKLNTALKKGGRPLAHPFFGTCDRIWLEFERLTERMDQWLVILKVHFFRYVAKELRRYKQENQVLFFDDLLLMLRDALQGDDGALQQRLRGRYRAALIDEFQDTDAVQYAIFATLFGQGGPPLFMIGDPKQAIYSFRGADIFTYLEAARHAAHRYTLTTNWRSTPAMVAAVNALFGRSPVPFLWPEIAFQPATTAETRSNPAGSAAALTFWYLDRPEPAHGRENWTKQTAFETIGVSLASEIRKMAADDDRAQGKETFREMAVLVRTNHQAREIKRYLTDAGVPAVVYHAGSVFHSPEARDLQRLLDAAADPSDEVKVRTAHCTPFFNLGGEALDFGDPAPAWWEAALERFAGYRALWIESGFIHMFRRLLLREEIAPRLLAEPHGERCLTNLLHLAELLHQAALARGLGPAELIQWLALQRRQDSDPSEAHQLRLESDDDAVTIMTVHKSKGLEFPVVFCPFVWEGMRPPLAPAVCHGQNDNDRRRLDFGSPALDRHLARMAEEQMAEELRLLYVAVTRAKRRCYLVWGRLPSWEHSALGYLLNPEIHAAWPKASWEALQSMSHALRQQDSATHRDHVADLVRHSRGTIAMIDLAREPFTADFSTRPPTVWAPPRFFRRSPLPSWKIASFSSLAHHRQAEGEIHDDLPENDTPRPESLFEDESDAASAAIGSIAQFEAGARAGLLFHDILEHIDFDLAQRANWKPIVEDRLLAHGYALGWTNPVLDMLGRVLTVPLNDGRTAPFSLGQVAPGDRLNELEFHLPLHAFDAADLRHALADCGPPLLQESVAPLLERLTFSLNGGYLKGYIDLVLRHGNRFYLVDWKSNHLGDRVAAYHPDRLAGVMAAEYYFLQYHLYTLAVDRFLTSSCPGYRFDSDFGGVFYCFIRGMRPSAGPPAGVFFDRPSQRTMERLQKLIKT